MRGSIPTLPLDLTQCPLSEIAGNPAWISDSPVRPGVIQQVKANLIQTQCNQPAKCVTGCVKSGARDRVREPASLACAAKQSLAANRRPSAWEENPIPRKISDLQVTDRRIAARSGISRHIGRHQHRIRHPRGTKKTAFSQPPIR
jgi:hypothetical protein